MLFWMVTVLAGSTVVPLLTVITVGPFESPPSVTVAPLRFSVPIVAVVSSE